jgi:hypothetical protein
MVYEAPKRAKPKKYWKINNLSRINQKSQETRVYEITLNQSIKT